jgi:hypothetical protein
MGFEHGELISLTQLHSVELAKENDALERN